MVAKAWAVYKNTAMYFGIIVTVSSTAVPFTLLTVLTLKSSRRLPIAKNLLHKSTRSSRVC